MPCTLAYRIQTAMPLNTRSAAAVMWERRPKPEVDHTWTDDLIWTHAAKCKRSFN